jgi:hypothetical protein
MPGKESPGPAGEESLDIAQGNESVIDQCILEKMEIEI